MSDQTFGPVRVERDGDVIVLVIDHPPVNAGSRQVRQGLLDGIALASQDSAARAVVIIGAGANFIAGSDIREFGKPLESPELPAVIAAIEACPKPVVAAIHGAALGGGFELALGCDARLAVADAIVGLPEVTLGMIPGAGGTQRLPRLTPIANAIEIICSGRRLQATEAARLGLIDQVVDSDLREAAVQFAVELAGRKRILGRSDAIASPEADTERAELAALKAGRHRPHVLAAIHAVKSALNVPFAEALTAERAIFNELRNSREAAALRHLFFAERDASKLMGQDNIKPLEICRVGVIGAGTMGIGIATAFLDGGYQVTLVDQNQDSLARARGTIEAGYNRLVGQKRLPDTESLRRLARLSSDTDLKTVSSCDLVIEAIFEDMDLKINLLRRLEQIVRPGTILASNTSYLNVDQMAAGISRPGDLIGLHFFNPAQMMRLLEIVRGRATSAETLATAIAIGKRLRKTAIISGVGEGFIGNRIYAAYRRQCEFMLEEGAYPETIDQAMEGFGMAMGPFAVGDMSGLDIAWKMRQRLAATRDPAARYVALPDQLCEQGRFGQKTGAGWYFYPPGQRKGVADPAVRAMIERASAEKNITRVEFSDETIVRRALIAMVNEAALLLEEGIARQASDIDLALVHGYGFPNYAGGPLFWAAGQTLDDLMQLLHQLEAASGAGFNRGDVAALWATLHNLA